MDWVVATVCIILGIGIVIISVITTYLLIHDLKNLCRVRETSCETCCVCMQTPPNVKLSCGHTELCIACASKLRTCPLCRRVIAEVRLTP